ncbi:MAG TPA: hypothetical protein VMF08_13605 [Candidatus Sulfotelmatobacter sp.]|nr:hypothetical protein [Candidatus Sulfotelmatobacter sp.]
MAIDSSMLQLYGKPIFTIDGTDDDLQFEQVIDFSGGEDDYRRSTLIAQNQCQKLVNVIVRDNYEAWTRPGADPFCPQLGQSGSSALPIHTLTYFDTPANKFILAICNGILSACAGQNQAWQTSFTAGTQGGPATYTAANTNTQVEIEQGVDTVLISDGVNAMAILDGSLNLTACTTGANDPPVGATILCWHTGRMFAAGFSGIGAGAVPRDTVAVSNLLAFGNGQWNLTTRSFRVGDGDGDPIIALYSMQDSNLAVFKANSIWLVSTPASADASGFGATTDVESVAFGVGCVGKRALCGVANDIFFMAQDGVRSLQRMQAAAGQWQLSAPISQPVQQYIEQINSAAQAGIVAASYKEFVFFAIPLGTSTVNNAVLVYNTRLSSWLGCWQNWTPSAWTTSRFNSVQQLLFGDSNGYVNYWKDAASTTDPATYTDNGQNIATTVWTRSFQFLQAVNDKFPYNCTLRFTAGLGTVSVAAVTDLAQTLSWQAQLQAAGDILGQHILGPFQLASVVPVKVEKSLRSIPAFNEMYLAISTSSGYMQLRNITVAAFLKALDN